MKKVLLACSGGYNSTYLLIKNAKAGNVVYPVYVKYNSNDENQINKQQFEIESLKRLLNQLIAKGYTSIRELLIVNFTLKFEENIKNHFYDSALFDKGILLDILNALFFIVSGYKKGNLGITEIQLGYSLGAKAISYANEINNYWSTLTSFIEPAYRHIIPHKIITPLIKFSKEQILTSLFTFYPSVAKNCWVCKEPVMLKKDEKEDKKKHTKTITRLFERCGGCNDCRQLNENIQSFFKEKMPELFKPNNVQQTITVDTSASTLLEDIDNLLNFREHKTKDGVNYYMQTFSMKDLGVDVSKATKQKPKEKTE